MNENVNVCITPKGEKPVLHFSQFDNENVFTVTVLADDGESAAVLTGLDIEFRIRKTDSHVVTIAPESVADNVITFKTTEQMCACCGQNIATVTLMKDDMVISTLDILVDIQRDILSGGLTSASDIHNLETQIEDILDDDLPGKLDVLVPPIVDSELGNYYTKSEVDTALSAKADSDDLAEVATTGDYDDLLNKPILLDQYVLDVDNKIKIMKTGNMVAVEIYANVAFNADGKTLAITIPEGYRTAYEVTFYAKIYDSSSYVDCIVTFNTAGQIIVSNLFTGSIPGASIFFLRNRSFVYYTE